MKQVSFVAFFLLGTVTSCTKQNIDATPSLHKKWQLQSILILKIDDSFNQGSCNYQTKPSDFYGPGSLSPCRLDDIWDFTNPAVLTVNAGANRCSPAEASSVSISYTLKGDSLHIDGKPYFIPYLTMDTMIVDYCTEINTAPPGTTIINTAKLGMKFVRAQ